MVHIKLEITKEEYEKAIAKSPYAIVNESILYGYGCYSAKVEEKDGHYYLEYDRGNSCD